MLFQQTKVTVSFLEFPLTFYRHFFHFFLTLLLNPLNIKHVLNQQKAKEAFCE